MPMVHFVQMEHMNERLIVNNNVLLKNTNKHSFVKDIKILLKNLIMKNVLQILIKTSLYCFAIMKNKT